MQRSSNAHYVPRRSFGEWLPEGTRCHRPACDVRAGVSSACSRLPKTHSRLGLAGGSTVGHLIDHASMILAYGGPASGPVASGYMFGVLRALDGSELTR